MLVDKSVSKSTHYEAPIPQCRNHSFCDLPREPYIDSENHANAPAQDLRSYVLSLSPQKRVDFLSESFLPLSTTVTWTLTTFAS